MPMGAFNNNTAMSHAVEKALELGGSLYKGLLDGW